MYSPIHTKPGIIAVMVALLTRTACLRSLTSITQRRLDRGDYSVISRRLNKEAAAAAAAEKNFSFIGIGQCFNLEHASVSHQQ